MTEQAQLNMLETKPLAGKLDLAARRLVLKHTWLRAVHISTFSKSTVLPDRNDCLGYTLR